jgi:hypothetical protein
MALKVSSLRVDPTRETEGLWVSSFKYDGVRFKVRSDESIAYKTAVNLESQRLLRKNGRADPAMEELAASRGRLLVDHILLGWEGLDVDYTREKALELLCDLSMRKLCEDIESAAHFAAQPEIEFIEDAVKN